jgi:hypothetical protein
MAQNEKCPAVRLALASAMQRVSPDPAFAIAEALAVHAEDATDTNLPLMIWYGIEPLVAEIPKEGAGLLAKARIPVIRQFIARRIALMAK